MAFTCMITLITFLLLLASAQTPSNAPTVENNPHMVTYQANLQASKPVRGTITGVSAEHGTGVDYNVNFFGFPDASVGPFAYHIHVNPVPEDGNCTAAGGHLDPYNVTDAYKCAGAAPELAAACQIGDLAGKHGKIDTAALNISSFQVRYLDLFLSTVPDTNAFFGNRSIVVHAFNGTRLNCGNFVLQSGDIDSSNGTSYGNATGSSPTVTAAGSGIGEAMPSQSIAGMNEGARGTEPWCITAIVGMGLVGLAMTAL